MTADLVREQKERERSLRERTMSFGEFSLLKTPWWNFIELENALMRLRLPQRGRMLDAGCSDGRWITHVRGRGYKDIVCVGVDFALSPLKELLSRNTGAMAVCADVSAGLFKPGSFDVVVSLQVVQQLSSAGERVRMLEHLRRALRPGGQYAITVLNRPSWAALVANGIEGPLLSSPELYVHLYTPEELKKDLESAGLAVREIVAINNLPVRYLKRIGPLGILPDLCITRFMKGLSSRKGRYLLATGGKA